MVEWIVGVIFLPVTFFKEVAKVNKDTEGITRTNMISALVCVTLAVGSWYLWSSLIAAGCFGVAAVITLFMNGEVFALVSKMGGYAIVAAAAGAGIAGIALMFGGPFPQVWMGTGILVFIGMSVRFGL